MVRKRRLSHRRLARGRQARPPHRPRREPRHAHANANVRILHRRPLLAPTVTWGPQPVAVQRAPITPKPTDSRAAAPTLTRTGSTTLTAPTVDTLVPRSPPIVPPQVGVLASCSAGRALSCPNSFFHRAPNGFGSFGAPKIWGTERPRRVFLKHFILRPQVLKHERLSDTSAQRLATLLPFLFFKDAVKPPRRCVFSRRPYSTTNHSPPCHILLGKVGMNTTF